MAAAREVIAGAREQIAITSMLIEATMKTTAEPHAKEELNPHAGKGSARQAAAPERHCCSEWPEGVSSGLAILGSTVKVKAVDAATEWSASSRICKQRFGQRYSLLGHARSGNCQKPDLRGSYVQVIKGETEGHVTRRDGGSLVQ